MDARNPVTDWSIDFDHFGPLRIEMIGPGRAALLLPLYLFL